MTMKHAIAFSLTLTVAGAVPPGASAQFDLDLQATEIINQAQELVNRVTRYTTLLNQFTSLDCSAQGMAAGAQASPVDEAAVVCDTLNMIGAFKDSYQQLLAAPTDLLNTPVPLPDWRDLLQQADTVDEADIRNVYQSGPNAADAAVATFERRRSWTGSPAVSSPARMPGRMPGPTSCNSRESSIAAVNRIGERVDADPDSRRGNIAHPHGRLHRG